MFTLCRLAGHPDIDKERQLPNIRYGHRQQTSFSFILGQFLYLAGQNLQFLAPWRKVALSRCCTIIHDLLGWTFLVGIVQFDFRENPQALSNFLQICC